MAGKHQKGISGSLPVPIEERFWPKVRKLPGWNACWVWIASFYRCGYGAVAFNGKVCEAHRVAYELAHGPIPEGIHVPHRCDNRACVRPDHLWLGTNTDNMKDRGSEGSGAAWE